METAEGERRMLLITSEELRRHNTASDLWISIQGKVYDVTGWTKDHPGGDLPLLNLAGQDVTDAFVAYHPGSAWRHLDRFLLVGHLADYRVSEASKDYRRLVAEFSRQGLFERKGHGTCATLCLMFVMFSTAVYGVLHTRSTWFHLLSGGLLGFLWIQSGWVGHDSGHHNVMRTPALNRLAQVVCGNCLTGINMAWWKRNHNAHHIACNSLDFDPDLQLMPMFAVSSKLFQSLIMRSYMSFYERKTINNFFDAVARFLVSYQHWTFYPVMCFARIHLFSRSVQLLLSKKTKVPNRGQELLGVAVFLLWYPLLVSRLPNWGERVMFVVSNLAVTGIQHVQFCLSHFASSVYVGPPRGNDWFEKQTMGTLDISCPPWMDWFHGGLQFQVEHHLFPRLPRCHLRKVAPFVRELCEKHNLPYSSASFWEANAMTIGTLRTAALQARDADVATNPAVPNNLVWEAVLNTHG